MVTALMAITVISVAAAIAALAWAHRLRTQERERSDARAAALAAAAETHGEADGGWKQVGGEWQWVANVTREADAAGTGGYASEAFFGTVQRDQPRSQLPVFAAAALVIFLGGALLFLNRADGDGVASSSHAAVRTNAPIELVALGHQREVRELKITGTVRNPASGVQLEGLTAVISLLDRNGALVSTKDVPLDYRALRPGDEAPFTVAVPDPGLIARYRVSFRAGRSVVPHVDRRGDAKLASALR